MVLERGPSRSILELRLQFWVVTPKRMEVFMADSSGSGAIGVVVGALLVLLLVGGGLFFYNSGGGGGSKGPSITIGQGK